MYFYFLVIKYKKAFTTSAFSIDLTNRTENLLKFLWFLFLVCSQVAAGNQVQIKTGLKEDIHREEDRVASLEETKVDAMREKEYKLGDLNLGDVPFPPQVRLHLRTKGCQAIVGVHDCVDGRVEQCKSSRVYMSRVG